MTFLRRSHDDVTFQMAPMIDIIFVLLLFFLVTSALQEQEKSITVDLPTSVAGEYDRRNQSEIVINVTREGKILIFNDPLSIEVLKEKLRQLAQLYRHSVPAVIVRGDRYANYGRIVEVLDVCAQANMRNVSFVSVEK